MIPKRLVRRISLSKPLLSLLWLVRGRSPLWLVYHVQRDWQPWANITQMSNFMTYSLNRIRFKFLTTRLGGYSQLFFFIDNIFIYRALSASQLCWKFMFTYCYMTHCLKGNIRKGRSENLSLSGATTIFLTQCNTSPSHRADQVVDCGLCNVGPLFFNGCVKLLDVCKNWNTRSYTPIQSIPNMLNGWHVRWVCWPWKNWDVFSFQELCTDPCNMGLCFIMLQHEVMVMLSNQHLDMPHLWGGWLSRSLTQI